MSSCLHSTAAVGGGGSIDERGYRTIDAVMKSMNYLENEHYFYMRLSSYSNRCGLPLSGLRDDLNLPVNRWSLSATPSREIVS